MQNKTNITDKKCSDTDLLICKVVLNILYEWHIDEGGLWHGYERLAIEAMVITGEEIPLSKIKEALRWLRKRGLVRVEAIYNQENGMLNGSGYFYNV